MNRLSICSVVRGRKLPRKNYWFPSNIGLYLTKMSLLFLKLIILKAFTFRSESVGLIRGTSLSIWVNSSIRICSADGASIWPFSKNEWKSEAKQKGKRAFYGSICQHHLNGVVWGRWKVSATFKNRLRQRKWKEKKMSEILTPRRSTRLLRKTKEDVVITKTKVQILFLHR